MRIDMCIDIFSDVGMDMCIDMWSQTCSIDMCIHLARVVWRHKTEDEFVVVEMAITIRVEPVGHHSLYHRSVPQAICHNGLDAMALGSWDLDNGM